ncbi:MAG TPA: HAD-IB family hydrolase [Acidimicrobiales bacterium]|jgi:HAD superfamily hydrolase (TIGR01490 family)|nr:HAD-IB family hydrolase [Acidimicrobiales bacterium]
MTDIAAFDFDGTLTTGGSVVPFLVAVSDRSTVVSAIAALWPRLLRGALAGGSAADQIKEELFARVLAGVSVEHLNSVSAAFAPDHLARHLRADLHRRFDWHRGRGDRVAIVSASPECYVREVGIRLGADTVIATRLEVAPNGSLTGRYQGKNCRGEEKLRRLQAWIGQRGHDQRLWAYGNSRGDLRMLSAADVGVNAGQLGRLGQLRHFDGLGETPPIVATDRDQPASGR